MNVCISHKDDVDGVSSAAMVLAALGGEVVLTDYTDLLADIRAVPAVATSVVICDLGFDDGGSEELLVALQNLAKRATVTVIDHHHVSKELRDVVGQVVRYVWDSRECASTLVYATFKDRLPPEAKVLAAYGAVTDYREGSPIASDIIGGMNRHTLFLEATLLSNALSRKPEIALKLVSELAKMKHPLEIRGVEKLAMAQLAQSRKYELRVSAEGRRDETGTVGWVEVGEKENPALFSTIVMGVIGTRVGAAFHDSKDGSVSASLRCSDGLGFHLGEFVGRYGLGKGWKGGGHANAAGCRLPDRQAFYDLVAALASETSRGASQ